MTVEKLDLSSPDLVQGNIEKIQALFPNVVTEGPDGLSIDFDALRQELSDTIVEGPQERYRLDWPGKRAAMLAANTPISKTLRPVREESVDFDTTQNLFIEGDNLDALKLLQDSYLGKVKMIYIDPPYNTGNDFVYSDTFRESLEEYLDQTGQLDDDGGRLIANLESNGRFHSDWLSMMFPRLKLARNLLRDDGAIFITIDDNEQAALKTLCDIVFGPANFRAAISWQKKYSVSNNFKGIASVRDIVFVYAKSEKFSNGLLPRTQDSIKRYQNPDNDPRGPWKPVDYWNIATVDQRPNCVYTIINPNTGKEINPTKKSWKFGPETHGKNVDENKIWWGKDGTNDVPALKLFLSEVKDGMIPHNWWPHTDAGHTDGAKKYLDKMFDGIAPFDTPKPLELLQRIHTIGNLENDDIVLDFFAGSASTFEASIKHDLEKSIGLKKIAIQIPEIPFPRSEAAKQGYATIAEISKERIRRAGAKILEENPDQVGKIDVGFRVLKIDSSNMKDVHADPRQLSQGELLDAVSHIKPDRSGEDLLFQVMLNQGIELSQSITRESVEGKMVYIVGQDNLIACFDDNITDDVVKNIAGRNPLYAIFRDESFKEPADKINAAQIFKQLTEGHTRMKVI